MSKKTIANSTSSVELKKRFTTVTPVSKGIALLLFIMLPLVGVLIGMNYQRISDMIMLNRMVANSDQGGVVLQLSGKDNGTIKYLKVGDRITVDRTSTLDITGLRSSNESVLFHVNDDTFQAVAPGTVTLSTTARPHCEIGHLCSQLMMEYKVEIIVK